MDKHLFVRNNFIPTVSDAGVYDEDGNLIESWFQLLVNEKVIVSDGIVKQGSNLSSYTGKLVIAEGITAIGNSTQFGGGFRWCNFTSIVLPNSIETIYYEAFASCNNLKSIEIPYGVKSILHEAFYLCKALEAIKLPDSLTHLGDEVFRYCTKLKSLVIPASVTSIGYGLFEDCDEFESVVVAENNSKYDSRDGCNAVIETQTNKLISACKGTVIPETVEIIGNSAFSNVKGITSIVIPDSVKTLEIFAFSNCYDLSTIVMGAGVTNIAAYAFQDQQSLESIVVSESNTKYDSRDNCNAIIETAANKLVVGCKGTVVPQGVKIIGAHAFVGVRNLTSIVIPDGVTSMEQGCFFRCNDLKEITIANSVTSINKNAFSVCSGLKTIHYSGTATGAPWGATNATLVP